MQTLIGAAQLQQEIKKSRFLARAIHADDSDEALEFVTRVAVRDATHNCWAYRIGAQYRFSDDGEPGGSAGRPILAAIDGQDLDRTIVVVTRWFGGIKLGVGGLVRAYGGCAAECLRVAPKQAIVERAHITIRCDYAVAAALRARLHEFDAHRRAERSGVDDVELDVDVARDALAAFDVFVRDLSRGRAIIEPAT